MIKKIKKINKRESGFTLIELLVVIGIIAVLATIGTISFGNAASKSRDAKRQSDLRTLSSGMQIYNTRKGIFPPDTTDATNNVASTWTGFISMLGVAGATPPRPSNEDYCYYRGPQGAIAGGSFYLLSTGFENDIPSDAITFATNGTGVMIISDDDDPDAATNPDCEDSGGATVGTNPCTVAGTQGGGIYCIKGTSGALF